MKLRTITALLLVAALALSAHAAEKIIAPGTGSQTTNDAFKLREVFPAIQSNDDELFKGAGSQVTLTYASTTVIDFFQPNFQTVVLAGSVTFTTANLVPGKTVAIQITGGASSRNFTAFPAWVFVGAAAPSALAANKTGLLVLRSFGTTDAAVVARYEVQP